jgi:hypothetical protein
VIFVGLLAGGWAMSELPGCSTENDTCEVAGNGPGGSTTTGYGGHHSHPGGWGGTGASCPCQGGGGTGGWLCPTTGGGGTGGEGGCPCQNLPHKHVFVSSAIYTGDLDGLAAADAKCETLAHAAGMMGTFKAWLSVWNTWQQLNAIDRIEGNGPWYRTDEVLAFHNHAALATVPLVAINRDETGALIPSDPQVWTGTKEGGVAAGQMAHCAQWLGATGAVGQVGKATTASAAWTQDMYRTCTEPGRIYCFEK